MNVYDLIYKKRNGENLSSEEVEFFVKGVTAGRIPGEQIAAWLMASFLRGLDGREMTALTKAMTHSGEILDLSSVPGRKVDKHSTGGVGDGTSLVLAPLLASAGAVVPMMSGRALGHTGGTLDKLESIPGFRVNLSADEFRRQLKSVGCAMIGQTASVAPADKKLYALRDVTATVDSVPLIAASIMSKKLAEGTDSLVLDVKTGSGAFMRERKDARSLARAMVSIGRGAGVKTLALISDMNQPLGNVAGNALEVRQSVQVLKGEGPADFRELILVLGTWMLVLSGLSKRPKEARKNLESLLKNGSALEKFRGMVEAQGGDPDVLERADALLPLAPLRRDVPAPRAGYVQRMDTRRVGMVVAGLGAGRSRPEDRVDHGVGLVFHKKIGDAVRSSEALATVYCRGEEQFEEARKLYQEAVVLGPRRPLKPPLVYEIIK